MFHSAVKRTVGMSFTVRENHYQSRRNPPTTSKNPRQGFFNHPGSFNAPPQMSFLSKVALVFSCCFFFFLTRPLSLSSFPFAPPHFHHAILLRLAVEMTLRANPPRHLLKGYTAQAFEKLKIKHQHPACSC